MLLQDLESWGIIHRIDQEKERERHYKANDNFLEMISNILQHRETGIVSQSLSKLRQIETKAQQNQSLKENPTTYTNCTNNQITNFHESEIFQPNQHINPKLGIS